MEVQLSKDRIEGLECGRCTGCCTALGVPSLNKPAGVACDKLIQVGLPGGRQTGCSVYGDHPPECRAYRCFWLQGVVGGGAPELRPDALGLVFGQEEMTFGGPALTAYECVSGASYTDTGRAVLDELSKHTLVVIIRMDQTRTVIGPRGALLAAYDKMVKIVRAAGLEGAFLHLKGDQDAQHPDGQ